MRQTLKSLKRKPQVISYDRARSIAILFAAGEDGPPLFLKRLIKHFRSDGKAAVALGYTSNLADPAKVTKEIQLCNRKDFFCHAKPKALFLRDFVVRDCDILIDLTASDNMQMKLIAAASNAKFKAGAHHPDFLAIFDLNIKVSDDCGDEELASHIVHYLKLIKTPG